MAHIPVDILYVAAELVSGRSIPLLVGITRLPIDQFLAGLVLSMGAVTGVFFSVYAGRATDPRHPLVFYHTLLQCSFSLFFTLSLLLSLARGIHYERGIILSLLPAFCAVAQALPLRGSTYLISLLLAGFCLAYCLTIPAPASEAERRALFQLPSVLASLDPSGSTEEEAVGVWGVLSRALTLYVLAFYASVQHFPAQALIPSKHTRLASPKYVHDARYALLVNMFAALLRVVAWYGVCFLQDNTLHVMLENDLTRGSWDSTCCVVYTVTLLYSACWTATLVREQLLPGLHLDGQPSRLKYLATLLALAAYYRQRNADLLLTLGVSLGGVSLLVTAFTLDPELLATVAK